MTDSLCVFTMGQRKNKALFCNLCCYSDSTFGIKQARTYAFNCELNSRDRSEGKLDGLKSDEHPSVGSIF